MKFETLEYSDLEEIKKLQPEGWSDITVPFELYIRKDFCFPVKVIENDRITGCGTSIVFGTTAWLAHIIVDREYRNKGIGGKIVEELLKNLKNKSIHTCSLIASDMGLSVYEKADFRIVSSYIYLNRTSPWNDFQVSENIYKFDKNDRGSILEMDKDISGETREVLISEYLPTAILYKANDELLGYYLPDLGDGMIYAITPAAGIELMKIKYAKTNKAAIPFENKAGLEFLKAHGFSEMENHGTRMLIGNDLDWKPQHIYSRAGGNLG